MPKLLEAKVAKLQDSPYIFLIQNYKFCLLKSVVTEQGLRIFYNEKSKKPSAVLRQFFPRAQLCSSCNTRLFLRGKSVIFASDYLPQNPFCHKPTTRTTRSGSVCEMKWSGTISILHCERSTYLQICKFILRGKKLFDFINSARLMTAGMECTVTFDEPRRIEVIELTICFSKIRQMVGDQRILDVVSLSDD